MGKQKILIVDDDLHIAELISLYMMKDGYETEEVYDGREAIKKAESFQPDLILLDLMLPGMDGYQVCTEIRKNSLQGRSFLRASLSLQRSTAVGSWWMRPLQILINISMMHTCPV